MRDWKSAQFRVAMGSLFLVIFFGSGLVPAQEPDPETTEVVTNKNAPPDTLASSNPTRRLIIPRKKQTAAQQLSDQQECFHWTCDQIDWDPYQAYDFLVAEGYTVALSRKEMEEGLICLARRGAEIGVVAGDLVGRPDMGTENSAEIGAAIALASGIINSSYLVQPENPEAQRAVARFERNLRKWDRKFAGCLSRKGYQVPPQ